MTFIVLIKTAAMDNNARKLELGKFRTGGARVFITTDSAVDIAKLDLCVIPSIHICLYSRSISKIGRVNS